MNRFREFAMENSETGKSDKYHIKSDKYHNIVFTKKYVRFLIPDYDVIDLAGFKSSLPEKNVCYHCYEVEWICWLRQH